MNEIKQDSGAVQFKEGEMIPGFGVGIRELCGPSIQHELYATADITFGEYQIALDSMNSEWPEIIHFPNAELRSTSEGAA